MKMVLPKDLREINEGQFAEMFNLLREKTKKFTDIDEGLLKENPQLLFIFRIILCLSQSEFGKLLKVDKQWVRHFESGRQGFKKSKMIPKCVKLISKLIERRMLDIDRSLKFLKNNQDARNKNLINFPERTVKFKRIFEMTEEDFKRQFKFILKETKDFSKFEPILIMRNPELLATFRVILNMNITKFSKAIGKDSWRIRRWESFKERIMPDGAKDVIEKIENIFVNKGLVCKPDLTNSLTNFRRFSFFKPDELDIMKVLYEHKISFEIHADLNCHMRKLNTDFAIPNPNNPRLAIEVTRIFDKNFGDIQRRIFFLDHKFQLIKISLPRVKTMMFVRCRNEKLAVVKGIFDRDIINTDFCIVNNVNEVVSKTFEVLNS